MPSNNLKVCTGACKQAKHPSEFNKNKNKKDGLNTICRECGKTNSRTYYSVHKEEQSLQIQEAKRERTRANRQFVMELLIKSGCADCPEKDPVVLEFDHIRDKEFDISFMLGQGASLKRITKEISKCVIRCANCHRRKTAKEQNWFKLQSSE